jgi:hypothetical protein
MRYPKGRNAILLKAWLIRKFISFSKKKTGNKLIVAIPKDVK